MDFIYTNNQGNKKILKSAQIQKNTKNKFEKLLLYIRPQSPQLQISPERKYNKIFKKNTERLFRELQKNYYNTEIPAILDINVEQNTERQFGKLCRDTATNNQKPLLLSN